MDDLVYSYLIFGALVQTLLFLDGASGLFGFGPLAEHDNIFERDRGAKSFLNDP